jgi:hypothetical protein
VNRIAAACVMMFFDTVLWGMEAVTQVTFAAQAAQKDLIIGIIVPETPEERTSEQESSNFVFRDCSAAVSAFQAPASGGFTMVTSNWESSLCHCLGTTKEQLHIGCVGYVAPALVPAASRLIGTPAGRAPKRVPRSRDAAD